MTRTRLLLLWLLLASQAALAATQKYSWQRGSVYGYGSTNILWITPFKNEQGEKFVILSSSQTKFSSNGNLKYCHNDAGLVTCFTVNTVLGTKIESSHALVKGSTEAGWFQDLDNGLLTIQEAVDVQAKANAESLPLKCATGQINGLMNLACVDASQRVDLPIETFTKSRIDDAEKEKAAAAAAAEEAERKLKAKDAEICHRRPKPEVPLVNWSGHVEIKSTYEVRSGRIVNVESKVVKGDPNRKAREQLFDSLRQNYIDNYRCVKNGTFEETWTFNID